MARAPQKSSSPQKGVAAVVVALLNGQSYVGVDKKGDSYHFPMSKLPKPDSLVKVINFDNDNNSGINSVKNYKHLSDYSKLIGGQAEIILTGIPLGMIGVVETENVQPDQVEQVGGYRFKDKSGWCIFVPRNYDPFRLVTAFGFETEEGERNWIVQRFLENKLITEYEGKQVLLDKGSIEAFAGRLTSDVANTVNKWKTEKKNLGQLRKILRSLEARQQEATVKLAEQTQILQNTNIELKQKLSDTVRLDVDFAEKKSLVGKLKRQLSEARARHLNEDDRLAKLQELSTLEDEAEALHKVRDVLKHIEAEKLVALHVALKMMPFTVLTGPSGSGKTSLLMGYAEALGMRYTLIPVQPNWTGVADLHGYVHPLWKRFVSTPFAQALARQVDKVDIIDLVILDEINLARVEYFLADYLSAFETRDRLVQIVPKDDAEAIKADDADHKHSWLTKGKGIVSVPPSLLIAGTANEDHTTQTFSDKFRDRAAVLPIEMTTQLKLSNFRSSVEEPQIEPIGRVSRKAWANWEEPYSSNPETLGKVLKEAEMCLTALANMGEKHGGFALSFRVWKDTKRFIEHALPLMKELEVPEAEDKVLDWALALRAAQKVAALPDSLFKREDREKYIRQLNSLKMSEFRLAKKLLGRNLL